MSVIHVPNKVSLFVQNPRPKEQPVTDLGAWPTDFPQQFGVVERNWNDPERKAYFPVGYLLHERVADLRGASHSYSVRLEPSGHVVSLDVLTCTRDTFVQMWNTGATVWALLQITHRGPSLSVSTRPFQ